MEDNKTEIEKLKSEMPKYEAALKILETQLEIINNDYKYKRNYNPIEHITTRIKTTKSIIKKLDKDNIPFTFENVEEYINDIVGVRIICAFKNDLFELIKILKSSNMIKVFREKDFLSTPNKEGYRSYHLNVYVPVELISGRVLVKAEIQIRTLAMDLWASLEHKLKYKSDYCTEEISKRLVEISDELDNIDNEMRDLVNIENQIKILNDYIDS